MSGDAIGLVVSLVALASIPAATIWVLWAGRKRPHQPERCATPGCGHDRSDHAFLWPDGGCGADFDGCLAYTPTPEGEQNA